MSDYKWNITFYVCPRIRAGYLDSCAIWRWIFRVAFAIVLEVQFRLWDGMMDNQKLLERITIDPDIAHGKPCIRHLRYPVEFLLELLSAGMSTEEILEDYEDLEADDIRAALVYATRLSQVKRIQPVLV